MKNIDCFFVDAYRAAKSSICFVLWPLVFIFILAFSPTLSSNAAGMEENAVIMPLAPKALLLDIKSKGRVLITVGERGHILYSHDSGNTWSQARVPTQRTLTSVFIKNEKEAWAVGHNRIILRTNDAGVSWEKIFESDSDDSPFLDILFVSDSIGIVIGAYGTYYRSIDNGVTWNEHFIYQDHDYHLNALAYTEDGDLFIAAEAGAVYRSTDLGNNWEHLDSGYLGSFFDVLVLADNHVVLLGLRGTLYQTHDKGATWSEPIETFKHSLFGGHVRSNELLVLGNSGFISRVAIAEEESKTLKVLNQIHLPARDTLVGITLNEDNELFFVGQHGLRRFDQAFNPLSYSFKNADEEGDKRKLKYKRKVCK